MYISEEVFKEFMQVVSAPENALPELEPSLHLKQMFEHLLEDSRQNPDTGRVVPSLRDSSGERMQQTLAELSLTPHPDAYRQLLAFIAKTESTVLKQLAFLAAEHNRDLIESQLHSGNFQFVSKPGEPGGFYVEIPVLQPDKLQEIDAAMEEEFEFGEELLQDWQVAPDRLVIYLNVEQKQEIPEFMDGLMANLNESIPMVSADYTIASA